MQATVESASLFGADQNSSAAKARDLLNSAAGAAKQELLNEARSIVAEVLPIDQLPSSLGTLHQHSSQPLKPIEVTAQPHSNKCQA